MITRYATLKSAGFGLMAAILLATTATSGQLARNLGPTLLHANSSIKRSDAEGFLQRWLILEPIRANGLTDSSVQAAVKVDYFPNPFSVLPEDGDQMTIGGTNLTWHAVDTKNYNVNLFHCARSLNRPTSNVMFWVVTVVHCPEEMTGVRLAIGSNAASVWWVNGQEVIGIYGERQTVIDDGVSKRLTLRKGPKRHAQRGVWPAHVDLGAITSEDRPIEGLLLLL